MPMRLRWFGPLLLGAVLSGCGSSSSGGGSGSTVAAATSGSGAPQASAPANLQTGPTMVLDTSGQGAFFDLPFPLDLRRDAEGDPDLTGLPNPRNVGFVNKIYRLAEQGTGGFSPSGAIYIQFDGPINPPIDDPLASVTPASSILLVDIDPSSPERLSRHPFHVQVSTMADSVRPANLLQVLPVPGLRLRTRTTYALVVLRSLGGPNTAWLGQGQDLSQLLAGKEPSGPLGLALGQSYRLLPAALTDLGIHPTDVAAATVFTTGDPTERLIRQAAHLNAQPPRPLARPLTLRDSYPAFNALKGFYAPDQFQTGWAPYALAGQGEIVVDGRDLPVPQSSALAEFQLSVPKGRMPATGFPLYFYVHGTGGLPNQAIDRGRWPSATVEPPLGSGIASNLAPLGWATSCAAGPFSPARIGILAADGYAAYNVFNPVAMRDNFKQMIFEMTQFRKLILNLRIDAALCPGTDASASPDGKVFFDPDRVVVSGQSLGSYLTGMLSAVLPGWRGAVLTGAGGSWIEFGFGPVDPIDLKLTLEALTLPPGEKLDRFHPLVTAFETGVGESDNTHYLPFVLQHPLPGHVAPHVLVIEGFRDLQVPTNLQRALVLALGVDFGGQDVNVVPDEQLLPVLPWGGLRQLPLPLVDNVSTPQGPRTGVVVRYPEDGIREGHHVAFQLDEPKRQIGEFLQALDQGVSPTVR